MIAELLKSHLMAQILLGKSDGKNRDTLRSDSLTLEESYLGSNPVVKMLPQLSSPWPQVVAWIIWVGRLLIPIFLGS